MNNSKEFVAKYVNDQLILISHTLNVIDVQLKDADVLAMPTVERLLKKIQLVLQGHSHGLRDLSDVEHKESNINFSATLAEVLTDVSGAVIGLYNKLRTEKVSKMLRDDYTALSLASLTYSMLFTTAQGLGISNVAEVSSKYLFDIPPLVMELNAIVPEVVLQELSKEGFSVDESVGAQAVEQSREAWTQ